MQNIKNLIQKSSPLAQVISFRCSQYIRRLYLGNHHCQHLQKYIFAMNKAYLRHKSSTDGDKFDISFQLIDPHFKVDRNFNFTRSLSENVSTFLSRVTANVEKVYAKSMRKKKVKNAENGQNSVTVMEPSEADAPAINVGLYINHVKIDSDATCEVVFKETNKVTLKLCNMEFEILVNAPYVENITLPNSMLATFPVYPQKLEALYVDEELSIFTWYKSFDKKNWELLNTGYIITPNSDCVGCYLKLVVIPMNTHHEGPKIEVISDKVIGAGPGKCPFERRQKVTQQRSAPTEFRVVSYNILADLYCDQEFTRTVLHPYCPTFALALDYRKQLFIKEILGYNSDIICLQEVDRKVYNHDLQPVMDRQGFSGEFCVKGGQVAEGVACFYRRKQFNLLSSEKLHLANSLETKPIFVDFATAINKNTKLKERFMERQTVTQLLTLECQETKNLVVVANTHLYFHPDADHIRLLQGAMSIKYVEEHVKKLQKKSKDKKVATIFCGDFNSVPSGGIYKLFIEGHVDSNFIDWASNKGEQVNGMQLSQSLPLKSACGTPAYTNYTTGFADCLDYIFYDANVLQVSQQVPMPNNDELIQHTALPSVVFPSDHISLCADLKWMQGEKCKSILNTKSMNEDQGKHTKVPESIVVHQRTEDKNNSNFDVEENFSLD